MYMHMCSSCNALSSPAKFVEVLGTGVLSGVFAMAMKGNDLPLEYKVIKTAERGPQSTVGKLPEVFQCGKTQISMILKNKGMVKQLYESNAKDDMYQACKRNRASEYVNFNDALYQWYQLCVKKNM